MFIPASRTTVRIPESRSKCFIHCMTAEPSAVSEVRRYTTRFLTEWRIGDEEVQSAELIMSELATNAINATPGQPFGIHLSVIADRPLLEVWDSSEDDPEQQDPDAGNEHGRGLMIVAALAKEWGRRPAMHGKYIWAKL